MTIKSTPPFPILPYTTFNHSSAHCSNRACTAATLNTVDSAGDVGQDASMTIGADRLGLISYYDATNGNLKVAHCSDLSCAPDRRR